MSPAEMIARYAHQVALRLPKRMRADVSAELRALLTEELTDKTARSAGGRGSNEAVAEELLIAFGSPGAAALEYHAPPPIIEPRHSRLFGKLALCFLAALAILAISVFLSEPAATGAASQAIAERIAEDSAKLALQFLGALLVVFWIAGVIRRHFPEREWKPARLPPVRDVDKVNRPVSIAAIVFWTLGLCVLAAGPAALFARIFGESSPVVDAFAYDSAFAAERARLLWSLLAAAIALQLWQTIEGRRRHLTRILNGALAIALSAAMVEIVIAGDVFAAEPANQYMKLAMALFGVYALAEVGSAFVRERSGARSDHPSA